MKTPRPSPPLLSLPIALLLLLSCSGKSAKSVAEIYRQAAPSVAFIRTPAATGSGVILEDGYVLTNAHVVWPYAEARVVLPEGEEFVSAKVHAFDLDADLALLGPVRRPAEPLRFSTNDNLQIGSPLYLIGYPAEVEDFPKPAITSGILSRIRESRFNNLRFLQSDATIVGGQSGGALLSSSAEIVGISGLTGMGHFALALSAPDVMRQVQTLKMQQQALSRQLATEKAALRFSVEMTQKWEQHTFVIELALGERLTWALSTSGDLEVTLFDPSGEQQEFPNPDADDSQQFEAQVSGPHFVTLSTADGKPSQATIDFSQPARAIRDPDDGRSIEFDRPAHGVIDTPGDRDRLHIQLNEGERIQIRVDGLLDVRAAVDQLTNPNGPLAVAKPAEGGLGLSAELEFTAIESGNYVLVIDQSTTDQGPTGYNVELTRGAQRPPLHLKSVFGAADL